MAKNKRVKTHLACTQCKHRNYTQVVGKKRTVGSLVLTKYCSWCRGHHSHKETK